MSVNVRVCLVAFLEASFFYQHNIGFESVKATFFDCIYTLHAFHQKLFLRAFLVFFLPFVPFWYIASSCPPPHFDCQYDDTNCIFFLFSFPWISCTSRDHIGFARASYIHSKLKNKGACKAFWRVEKRVRWAKWRSGTKKNFLSIPSTFHRVGVRKGIKTQTFYWFVIVLVFLNTACVAVEHHGQEAWLTDFLCKFWTHFHNSYSQSSLPSLIDSCVKKSQLLSIFPNFLSVAS